MHGSVSMMTARVCIQSWRLSAPMQCDGRQCSCDTPGDTPFNLRAETVGATGPFQAGVVRFSCDTPQMLDRVGVLCGGGGKGSAPRLHRRGYVRGLKGRDTQKHTHTQRNVHTNVASPL